MEKFICVAKCHELDDCENNCLKLTHCIDTKKGIADKEKRGDYCPCGNVAKWEEVKEYIGETRAGTGDILLVNVLGNHLSVSDLKYNPCLEMVFEDEKEQWDHYCKAFKITILKSKIEKSSHNGFLRVNFKDCILKELTKEEVEELVRNY